MSWLSESAALVRQSALYFPKNLNALGAGCLLASASLLSLAAHAAPRGVALSERAEQCIAGAALYHHVNAAVLKAIVRHESRGRANTITRNSNDTIDVGLTGINSVHFPELRQKGVAPEHLLDECVSVYVGAWKYSKKVYKYGNSWRAIGAYHSETAYYNSRYQTLIYNELVDMGVILNGLKLRAPSIMRP